MENEYYDLFGVPAPEAGEEGQETADPAVTDTETGEEGQEVADPVEAPEGEEAQQTPEERHRQAAQRRQQETEEAVNRALAQQKEANDAFLARVLKSVGLTNRYADNKPVTNAEEFEAWDRAQRAAALQRDLQAGKLTPDGLREALAGMPEVRDLIENAQRQEAAAKQAQERAGKESFAARREMELAEIRKLNPSIQSLDDIVAMPTGKDFIQQVQRGASFLEAYRLANFDSIMAGRRAAGEQAARNAAAGMQHLQQTRLQGTGGKEVPQSVKEMYRLYNPGMTEKEIFDHYNRL